MISCIFANVIENIKKSIIFTSSAQEVWKSLEIWFSQLSRLRKFKLCREVYDLKQRGRSVIDYYTSVYALWEKIEELNVCPPLTKLTGSANYKTWRREMELALGSKRKLGFVTSAIKRDKLMKLRFCTSGLEESLDQVPSSEWAEKQRGRSVIDYYTSLYTLWEEIEGLNVYPPLTEVNTEMRAYLNVVKTMKEEQ
ncbi:Replicase large subunit [Bienertia sinuspersici]